MSVMCGCSGLLVCPDGSHYECMLPLPRAEPQGMNSALWCNTQRVKCLTRVSEVLLQPTLVVASGLLLLLRGCQATWGQTYIYIQVLVL